MPKLKGSTKKDEKAKATQERQFEMEYKAKLGEALHRIRIYDDTLVKSYALIWERCNTAMQSRLEQRTDYKSTIYNDPIEPLQAIK
jgi:phosphate uptake regulator